MKRLAFFAVFFWLSVLVALVARRPRPVIAEPWVEDDDGVQPVDPRLAALAAAEARGWMTAAEEDVVYPSPMGRVWPHGTYAFSRERWLADHTFVSEGDRGARSCRHADAAGTYDCWRNISDHPADLTDHERLRDAA